MTREQRVIRGTALIRGVLRDFDLSADPMIFHLLNDALASLEEVVVLLSQEVPS